MTDYILVHGGSHGSWCWEATVDALSARGHGVFTVDLPGRDDATADVSLESWVEALGREVDALRAGGGAAPVIVAHSMGGLTAGQFAERRPADVQSIVFVCAVAPTDGQSGLEALSEGGSDSELLADGALVASADGRTVTVDPEAARRAFYNECPPDVADAAVARLCPEHVAPMATPLELGPGFGSVAKRWIAATRDHTVPPWLQRRMAERMAAPVSTLEADHSPFLSANVEFLRLLDDGGAARS